MPYTPFLADIGKQLGGVMMQKGQQDLIQNAYMGAPGALEQLYAVNPQAAEQIKQSKVREEQQGLQSQDRKAQAIEKLRQIKADVQKQIANFDNYDQAKAYYDQQVQMNQELINMAGITPDQLELTQEGFNQIKQAFKPKEEDIEKVKSSDILPDGTAIMVMDSGETRVTDPTGNTLQGEARAAAIEKAQEFGIDIQQRRAQGREIGKWSAEKAKDVFDRADKIRENNQTLRDVIDEVKAGGKSGPLMSKLPSLTAATIRLDSLKNRLGLDVVGSVTFGSLSEGELKLALDTAVPDLPGPELAAWAEKKITAQEKLLGYLEGQAAFLSEPGNKPTDWMEYVKSKKKQETTQGQSPGIPQQAIDFLKANPNLKDQFEAKYGQGSAMKILGQ